jgi:hypothetical protein
MNDDTEAFFEALEANTPMIVLIAPSAVTVFDDIFRLISFLKSRGVLAVFDVAFGAELTAKSYIEYARKEKPKTIIAQPCPAIVNYCELYAPHLIQYLAPVHSPMLHTAIMIKNFFPELADAKIAALSPCAAKKREFEETGYIDFNVALIRLKEVIEQRYIDLHDFTPCDFDGPMAERAVSFSSPGGLRDTVVRDMPALSPKIRRIEGSSTVYKYLNDIPRMLEENVAPFLIDCLSCSTGCNGGPGTGNYGLPVAMLERRIEERLKKQKQRNKLIFGINRVKGELSHYWKPGIYSRSYKDCSENLSGYRKPTQKDLDIIYHKMKKTTESDFLNCAACGYGNCRGMAEAIFNKLNRVENCHHYLKKEIDERLHEHQSILQYVRDGIFLLESNGRILPSYSKALEEIFRRDILAGVPIMTVFSGFFDKEKLKEISAFMDKVFDVSVPDNELQKENPLKEVKAQFANLDGGFDTHCLHFAIERIGDGNTIQKLLVIVRDGGIGGITAGNTANTVQSEAVEVKDNSVPANGEPVPGGAKNLISEFNKIENKFNTFVKNKELKSVLSAFVEKWLLFCAPDSEKYNDEGISVDAYTDGGNVHILCCRGHARMDINKLIARSAADGLITEDTANFSMREKLNYLLKIEFSDIKDKLKGFSCRKIQFSNKKNSCVLNLVFPKEILQ